MNRLHPRRPWLAWTLGLALALSACGGTTTQPRPPSFSHAPGSQLSARESLQIRFGESMNPGSLVLGEGFGTQGTVTWSSTQHPNDTLTLSPPASGWVGQPRLSAQVRSRLGAPQQPLSASYEVVVRLGTFQAASVVIGQADFSGYQYNQGNASGPSANTLSSPAGNPAIGPEGHFFLTDTLNHRLLSFRQLPTRNNASADWVQGQPDFNTNGPGVGPVSFGYPMSVAIHGQAMAMADVVNSRVLIWHRLPTAPGTAPDVVLGQPDLTSNGAACGPTQLRFPTGVAFSPTGQLVVADSENHRVLVWSGLPTRHGQAPDLVLGQQNFTHCAPNDADQDGVQDTASTAHTLNRPRGVWTDGTRLVISDTYNSRVLVWNTFPTRHFQPADTVLGQSDFTLSSPNDDDQNGSVDATPSARTLHTPWTVASNGVQLAVSDTNNHRVLIWNRMPTASFQPADVVLGQGDFTRSQAHDTNQDGVPDATPSAYTVSGPAGLLFHGNRLVVVQDGDGSSRVTLFEGR